jgi:hypothetical protein
MINAVLLSGSGQMKAFLAVAALTALIAAPLASIAAPGVNANLATAYEANNIDLGCLRGDLRATRYPTNFYDPSTHERIMYNISQCTGGFIMGTNTDTWKSWHAEINVNGDMSGKDADGNSWKYDRKAKLYTNLGTGKSCADANLRHVCAQ